MIGPIFTHLQETLQDVVRMAFLHSSRASGRVSAPLKAAADVHFVGLSAGSDDTTLLHFEVPQFGSAAPGLFQQKLLWEDGPNAEETSFELLATALYDVTSLRNDSNRFDRPFLRRIAGYRRILDRGIEQIALPDAAAKQRGSLNAASVAAANELSAMTPRPKRVRVTGKLDVMGASQGILKIHLRPGEIVTAIWQGQPPIESLHDLFNSEVVVEGEGVFRPSGAILRIDANAIALAQPNDEFFRRLPAGASPRDPTRLIQLRVGESPVYPKILGSIPAEESDEDFAAAVEAVS